MPPDYGRDEEFQRSYAASAKDPEAWAAIKSDWLELDSHDAYRLRLQERAAAADPESVQP